MSTRRTRLGVQTLEAREVPTTGLVSALGVGSSTDNVNTAARDVAADAAGNSYMTGRFAGTVDFDPANDRLGGGDVLTARGFMDAFVAKYAPDGSLVWAKRMGGDSAQGADEGWAIAVSAAGVVAVAGTMDGAGDFGADTLVSAGGYDGFVARLDASTGAVAWARRWGTGLRDAGRGVGVDGNGNVYAASVRTGAAADTGYDVLKFGPTGSPVWARTLVTNQVYLFSSPTCDLAVDPAGNVHLVGTFKGTVDLNPGTAKRDVYTVSSGNEGGFALKLDTAGAFVWATPFTGIFQNGRSGKAEAQAVAVDGGGNVFVGGSYKGPVDFDPGSAVTPLPYGPGLYSDGGYLVRLTPSGALGWARGLVEDYAAGEANITVNGLATDAAGSVYATGNYYGTVDFDPGAGTDYHRSMVRDDGTRENTDIFVVKLTAAGTYDWAETFGGTGYDYGYGVAVDSAGTVHLAGLYWSASIDFDPDPLAVSALTKTGYNQWLFLVRLRQN